ncbi:MAG: glycosyltransferase [Bacilli bacterium]
MKENKYLFIGGYFSNIDEKEILKNSISSVQYAANGFQKNLMYGIKKNIENEKNFYCISAPFVGAYPMGYKKARFISNNNSEYVSFINLFAIKNVFRTKALEKLIKKKYMTQFQKSKLTIFVYSPHNPFLEVAINLKNKLKNVHICLIVPDLPQYMNLSKKQSRLYKALKSIDLKRFKQNIKYVDSFVLLTSEMNDAINFLEKPYCVVEGIIDTTEISLDQSILEKHSLIKGEYILYTGTLNEKFGVINLVDSFAGIENKKGKKLVIAGRGDSEFRIKEYEKHDESIVYLGQVTNGEAKALQCNASFLINPRNNEEDFTKYSFPSKNMEYLRSGRPVICYKLDGIPEDYNDIFHYVDKSLEEKIQEFLLLDKNDLDIIGIKGKNYVINFKNSKIQSKKIVELIEGVNINV